MTAKIIPWPWSSSCRRPLRSWQEQPIEINTIQVMQRVPKWDTPAGNHGVVVLIIIDWMFVLMNTTTMILCKHDVAQKDFAIVKILKDLDRTPLKEANQWNINCLLLPLTNPKPFLGCSTFLFQVFANFHFSLRKCTLARHHSLLAQRRFVLHWQLVYFHKIISELLVYY